MNEKKVFYNYVKSTIPFYTDYKIIKSLYAKNNSGIFLIENKSTKEQFVLKSIKDLGDSMEDRLCSVLKHENIVECYEVRSFNTSLHLRFEYANLGSLQDKIDKEKILSEKETKHIIKDILNGLKYCHNMYICHNDLKPANILVFQNKDSIIYKIADWGLAYTDSDIEKNEVIGSYYYMAPEVWNNENHYCDKSDIWSVGVICYYCIEGFLPFYKETLGALHNTILLNKPNFTCSPEAQKFIKNLLNSDPNKRPTSKQALQENWLN